MAPADCPFFAENQINAAVIPALFPTPLPLS
jgi:hypothetical protein